MWKLSRLKVSGDHEWVQLTAENDRELENAARILRADIHQRGAGQPRHLDLDIHKAALALRYGAREEE